MARKEEVLWRGRTEGSLCEQGNATGCVNRKPLVVIGRLSVEWAADWRRSSSLQRAD